MTHQASNSSIETLIETNPVLAFDTIIQKSRDRSSPLGDRKQLVNLVWRSIFALADHSLEENNISGQAIEFLERGNDLEQKTLIIGCLLRLIPEPFAQWISENPWRPKVIALLDSEVKILIRGRREYTELMAHQKMEMIKQEVKSGEKAFIDSLKLLTSLDRMANQRHNLMKAIKANIGPLFIIPFLPEGYEAYLGEIYNKIENYLNRQESLGIVDIVDSIKEELKEFIELFENNGTIYSLLIAEQVGKKLLRHIEEDFASNPATQPARVIIEKRSSKKYPLHSVDKEINLGFWVKNEGPGYAYNIRLMLMSDDSLSLSTEEVDVGRFDPGAMQLIEVPAKVLQASKHVDVFIQIDWKNFDNTKHTEDFSLTAQAQRDDIDWEKLKQIDPYSLEPVTTEDELVGRKDLINRLLATLKAPSVGSSIIKGQKRVGKTSLAKAIQSHLKHEGYLVVYLEAGDYVQPAPSATVKSLGSSIYRKMVDCDERLDHISEPTFEDALAPLAAFLDEAKKIISDRRIAIILDEFDELPLDLYARGAMGDSFFLTLRSISSRSFLGFVLVGSEKIAHVMDCQGDKLNKWNVVPVDYFSRETDWSDYRELIQRPVGDTLEYTEGALQLLHELTAGNPYYTKLICQRGFQMAVDRGDCSITRTEILKAVEVAIREIDRNTFQHFWEDGIFERGDRATEKSIRRRKILIAVSDVLGTQTPAPKKEITKHPLVSEVASLDSDLKEFVTRKILVSNVQGDAFDFKVPLFSMWMRGRGVDDVIATFSDLDAALRERQKEEEIKVHSKEIRELVGNWGQYKGLVITEDKVRAWLEQFSGVREQRAMFDLLEGLHFFSHANIRNKMAEVHDFVKRGIVHHIERGKSKKTKTLKRSDILVSYLDYPAKSGSHIARLYVDEASIYTENVVEKGKLLQELEKRKEIQVLVFLDDFVGTGNSASTYLQEIDDVIGNTVLQKGIRVVFVAVVAYVDGWKHLESITENLKMPVRLHVCEILDETAKCFVDNSSVFSDASQREFAKELALKYGKILEKNCPLGYGGLEMAVVFERSCPNNSLPILWSESSSLKWTALFKRL